MFNIEHCKEELKHISQPGKTLCNFTDFVLHENVNLWRDGTGFLTFGELEAYWNWRSFIGVRPQFKAPVSQLSGTASQGKAKGSKQTGNKKKQTPLSQIHYLPRYQPVNRQIF
jgi:hypothetical protein